MWMKNAGESDIHEELDGRMRAMLMQMKMENCKSAAGPISLSAGENHSFPVFLLFMFCIVLFCLVFHVYSISTSTIMGQLC